MIDASHRHITATSGQKVILSCRLNSSQYSHLSSSYQLIWIRQTHLPYEADSIIAHNQDLLIVDSRLSVQHTDVEYSLIITDVTRHDEGVYACEINSQPPARSWLHLHIQGRRSCSYVHRWRTT
jgi:hypothetical protein